MQSILREDQDLGDADPVANGTDLRRKILAAKASKSAGSSLEFLKDAFFTPIKLRPVVLPDSDFHPMVMPGACVKVDKGSPLGIAGVRTVM
jgi:hypothetical protein